jgi:hypothetical protein
MANQAISFRWVVPPSALQKAYTKYGFKVIVAIKAIADYIATQAQNEMRQNAPWTDRTGNARNGLFSIAEQAAIDTVMIYFSHGHSIHYGIYLETMRGGAYAIIMPTMQRIYPQLEKMLKGLFR